jgi:tRNA pseudouridine13 synthase
MLETVLDSNLPLAMPPIVIHQVDALRGKGGGRIKVHPTDFHVEEVPAYQPAGEGGFHFLWIEKEDVSAPELVRQVAQRLGIHRQDVGMAGMKDRRALTRQWLSVPADTPNPLDALDGPVGQTGRIELLKTKRHPHNLKTGHLRANRFIIRVYDRDLRLDQGVQERLTHYQTDGFPNSFGYQRFGDGDSLRLGVDVLRGRRIRDKRRLRLGVSAVQSWIFNQWLATRVREGLIHKALRGDLLKKRLGGGIFLCETPGVDTERITQGELVVTGPMPGSKWRAAQHEAGQLEQAVMKDASLPEELFKPLKKIAPGTRRPALTWPEDVSCVRDGESLVLSFTLPSGSYATVFLALLCGDDLQDLGHGPRGPVTHLARQEIS